MFRKVLLASAVTLALVPGLSWSLGLGGIRTQSALNQPFSGEIELYDVKPDELDTVRAVLAPEEEFAKAGSPRPHFLTNLRFAPQVAPSGRTVIRIESREPIREPYLDFLVEVTWPEGRMVKGYTVLLDPPVTLNRQAPRVQPPRRVRRAPPSVAPQTPTPSPAVPRDATGYPLRYGPVTAGTGLWRVARAMAPEGATVPQTAMALYRNNQRAFIRGDINKLKLGAVLEVPTPEELFALDARAADREFRTAMSGGRVTATPITDVSRAAQPGDRLEIAPAPPVVAQEPGQGPPRETGVAESPELGSIQRDLLLVQESTESTRQEAGELRARIQELETQLADIKRLLELRNEQLAQLQSAAAGAEDVPSAAEASDVPPEAAQDAGPAEDPGAVDLPAEVEVTAAQAAEGVEEPAASPAPSETVELAQVPDPAQPTATTDGSVSQPPAPDVLPGDDTDLTGSPPEDAADSPDEAPGPQIAEERELGPPAEEPTAAIPTTGIESAEPADSRVVAAAAERESAPGEEAGLAREIDETPTEVAAQPEAPAEPAGAAPAESGALPGLTATLTGFWQGAPPTTKGLIAGVPLLLLALSWLMLRQRRRTEAQPETVGAATEVQPSEGHPVSGERAADRAPLPEGAEAARPEATSQSSAPFSGFDNLEDETEEADLISEADVYIAYGRYREAEKLLSEGIKKAPERLDLKFKLAEAHYGSKNAEALQGLVSELRAAGAEAVHPELWQRLLGLSRELAGAGGTAPEPKVGTTGAAAVASAPSELPSALDAAGAGEGRSPSEVADYSLAGLLEEESASRPGPETIDAPGAARVAFGQSAEGGPPSDAYGGDLELDVETLGPVGAPPRPSEESAAAGSGEAGDLKLEELDNLQELTLVDAGSVESRPETAPSQPPPRTPPAADTVPPAGTPADSLDITPVGKDSAASDVLSSQWQMDSGLWDEVATKIDLARAYMEMADPDAARVILEEVIAEGNDEQQVEAREMLSRLG